MTHHSEPAREAVAQWRYSINYGPDGEANYANVHAADGQFVGNLRTHHAIAICNAFAVCERLASSPAPAAGGLEAVQALDRLEKACDGVAATRSQATYLAMIDNDNAEDALQELDHARRAAREIVRAAVASPAATSAETQGGDGVREALERVRCDCQSTIDLYHRTGSSFTSPGGDEYEPTSFVIAKMEELISIADAALAPLGEE